MKIKHWQIALSFVMLVSLACTCSALPDLTGTASELATQAAAASDLATQIATAVGTPRAVAPTITVARGGTAAPKATAGKYDTVFPMPASVKNFTGTGKEGAVNFQTDMNVKDTITFYRKEFAAMGLKERTINTAITDATFSMVFDGYANGKAIVIQGVSLGANSTNVNIRFESL